MVDRTDFPVEVEKVYRRFERWRSVRRGRSPIPERLWMAAAKVAREYGVNATSKALGLEFKKLKAFAEAGERVKKAVPAPQFLELVAPPAGVADCVIEMESRRGKMRIEWKGGVAPDLAGLSRMLWERE